MNIRVQEALDDRNHLRREDRIDGVGSAIDNQSRVGGVLLGSKVKQPLSMISHEPVVREGPTSAAQ